MLYYIEIKKANGKYKMTNAKLFNMYMDETMLASLKCESKKLRIGVSQYIRLILNGDMSRRTDLDETGKE